MAMAVNRIRSVFQVPRKGETFELRSGLVWSPRACIAMELEADDDLSTGFPIRTREVASLKTRS